MRLFYKPRKWRGLLRQQYFDETGREDYGDPAFLAWLDVWELDPSAPQPPADPLTPAHKTD